MSLKKESLVFTGEMSIVSAVITIPSAIALFVLDYFEGIVPKISSIIIMLISIGFFLFIYTQFRKLLVERFHFKHLANILAWMLEKWDTENTASRAQWKVTREKDPK